MKRGRERRRKGNESRKGKRIQHKKDIPVTDGWTEDRIDFNYSGPMVSGITHRTMPSF